MSKKIDIHKQRYKAIKNFVNFKFDARKQFTPYQKTKIKKYYDLINQLTTRPYQLYTSKDKKRLSKVKEFAQQPSSGYSDLKYAFVPNAGEKLKITIDSKGHVKTANKYITSTVIFFDKNELIKNPAAHVNKLIKNTKFKRFTVHADVHEIPRSVGRSHVADYVAQLTSRYGDDTQNNYFGNWLNSMSGHTFRNQDDFIDYMSDKQKAKNKIKNERQKAKDRARKAKVRFKAKNKK